MSEIRYRAKIDHTEKTIDTLYRMQRYTYDKPRILLRLGIGLAMAEARAEHAFHGLAQAHAPCADLGLSGTDNAEDTALGVLQDLYLELLAPGVKVGAGVLDG